MNTKATNIIKKVIYLIIFILMIWAFIFLSKKYTQEAITNDTITSYYPKVTSAKFEVAKANQVKSLLKEGKNIIIIGNSESKYSEKYILLVQ